MVPSYREKERTTLLPGVCKFCLQYDRRPDERFGVRFGMRNLGSLSHWGGDICDELNNRMIDVCCL